MEFKAKKDIGKVINIPNNITSYVSYITNTYLFQIQNQYNRRKEIKWSKDRRIVFL